MHTKSNIVTYDDGCYFLREYNTNKSITEKSTTSIYIKSPAAIANKSTTSRARREVEAAEDAI